MIKISERERKESISNVSKVSMDSARVLQSPFREAFFLGASIDYKTNPDSKESDHSYVKKLGYKPEMMPDCSMYAKGLKAFSLSSYGDWGTYYVDEGDNETHSMFLDMVEKGIITPWRIRKYLRLEGETLTYDYDERGWRCYDGEKWTSSGNPFDLILKEMENDLGESGLFDDNSISLF